MARTTMTTTTVHLRCDRCGAEAEFDQDRQRSALSEWPVFQVNARQVGPPLQDLGVKGHLVADLCPRCSAHVLADLQKGQTGE